MMGLQAIAAVSIANNKECSKLTMEDEEKDSHSQLLLYASATLMPTIHNTTILGNWMFDIERQ